jgi:hypothetical protein
LLNLELDPRHLVALSLPLTYGISMPKRGAPRIG